MEEMKYIHIHHTYRCILLDFTGKYKLTKALVCERGRKNHRYVDLLVFVGVNAVYSLIE